MAPQNSIYDKRTKSLKIDISLTFVITKYSKFVFVIGALNMSSPAQNQDHDISEGGFFFLSIKLLQVRAI